VIACPVTSCRISTMEGTEKWRIENRPWRFRKTTTRSSRPTGQGSRSTTSCERCCGPSEVTPSSQFPRSHPTQSDSAAPEDHLPVSHPNGSPIWHGSPRGAHALPRGPLLPERPHPSGNPRSSPHERPSAHPLGSGRPPVATFACPWSLAPLRSPTSTVARPELRRAAPRRTASACAFFARRRHAGPPAIARSLPDRA
jgi:hypothetical protein